ncbi:hypothetical protein WJX72_004999 [[Myrmecia] bisecta]|uniref:Ubiquitin fusion degradaton protein n=1 Tax=[Myrmecia] bisecta TaxID=41462 RepID=A0AAW1QA37_9CHLO
MFGLFGGLHGGGTFEANYRCYPVSFLDKLDAENGDKIFLPPSALDRLASLQIEFPMLFKLENRKAGRSTHCGVLEFVAEEGMVYMPYWMMQNLLLEEGDIVKIQSANLVKGSYVKLQPHTQDFLDITNPKAVLETTLRGYSCLTVGDCICLHYNNKRYYIDIVEAKPQNAISVIETDCEVDFAPPLDYVEPNRDEGKQAAAAEPMAADVADGAAEPAAPSEPEEPKFIPFVGGGRRLDGKTVAGNGPSTSASGPPTSSGPVRAAAGPSGSGSTPATASTSAAVAKRPAGKVMFGGGNRLLEKQMAAQQDKAAPTAPAPKKEEKKDEAEAPKFAAFTGKGRSLKD